MLNFDIFVFIILFICLLLCMVVYHYARKKIRAAIQKEKNVVHKKNSVFCILLGLIIALSSLIFHINIQIDIIQSPNFFRFLKEMTAEPILIGTIILFLIGLTLFLIGIYSVRMRKELLAKSE